MKILLNYQIEDNHAQISKKNQHQSHWTWCEKENLEDPVARNRHGAPMQSTNGVHCRAERVPHGVSTSVDCRAPSGCSEARH